MYRRKASVTEPCCLRSAASSDAPKRHQYSPFPLNLSAQHSLLTGTYSTSPPKHTANAAANPEPPCPIAKLDTLVSSAAWHFSRPGYPRTIWTTDIAGTSGLGSTLTDPTTSNHNGTSTRRALALRNTQESTCYLAKVNHPEPTQLYMGASRSVVIEASTRSVRHTLSQPIAGRLCFVPKPR